MWSDIEKFKNDIKNDIKKELSKNIMMFKMLPNSTNHVYCILILNT